MADIAAQIANTASMALSNASAILAADPTRAVPLGTFLVVLLRWPACLLRAAMVAVCSVAFIGRIPAPYHMGVALLLVVPPPKKKAAAVDKRAVNSSATRTTARLVAFYEAHAPEKATSANIDDVLVKYLGQEPKLFAMLEEPFFLAIEEAYRRVGTPEKASLFFKLHELQTCSWARRRSAA
ncbi:hypothetical protein JL721_12241 [Aureococcus anophagefferens]|nr:hypothetical protein JL721_12241 [Aureococcus anophagefferens]